MHTIISEKVLYKKEFGWFLPHFLGDGSTYLEYCKLQKYLFLFMVDPYHLC